MLQHSELRRCDLTLLTSRFHQIGLNFLTSKAWPLLLACVFFRFWANVNEACFRFTIGKPFPMQSSHPFLGQMKRNAQKWNLPSHPLTCWECQACHDYHHSVRQRERERETRSTNFPHPRRGKIASSKSEIRKKKNCSLWPESAFSFVSRRRVIPPSLFAHGSVN